MLPLLISYILLSHIQFGHSCCLNDGSSTTVEDQRQPVLEADIERLDRFHRILTGARILDAIQQIDAPVDTDQWHDINSYLKDILANKTQETIQELKQSPIAKHTYLQGRLTHRIRHGRSRYRYRLYRRLRRSESSDKTAGTTCSVSVQYSSGRSSKGVFRDVTMQDAEIWLHGNCTYWTQLQNSIISSRLSSTSSNQTTIDFTIQPGQCTSLATSEWIKIRLSKKQKEFVYNKNFMFQISFNSQQDCNSVRKDWLTTAPVLHLEWMVMDSSNSSTEKRQRRDVPTRPRSTERQRRIKDCNEMWDQGLLNRLSSDESSKRLQYDLLPCCRRTIEVSFSQLGWQHWVVSPISFNTSYCVGRCSSYIGFESMAHSLYADMMQTLPKIIAMGKSPCCTPVKFSSLTATVRQNPDEEVITVLDNVIVDQCGCI